MIFHIKQHVVEDLGFIPSLSDWLSCIQPARWMTRSQRLSEEIEPGEERQPENRTA